MGIRVLRKANTIVKILTMTNEHPDFYRLAGPFLAKRAIARELGNGSIAYGVIWDDEKKIWFLAMLDGKVLGFATMLPHSKHLIQFCEAYVLPEYREQGIHTRLIEERMAHCEPGTTIQVIIFNKSVHEYEGQGFTFKREVGKSWTEVTRVV